MGNRPLDSHHFHFVLMYLLYLRVFPEGLGGGSRGSLCPCYRLTLDEVLVSAAGGKSDKSKTDSRNLHSKDVEDHT